ncbi:hypothetical protein SCLCIDRAFT_436680 [Scleroderma citrinum Foug A]|uniref:Uncharacterized protein n=1 Tax=Scleroderma citrinum Foug A TaxID=1036808 RepID=A0A0C3DBH6_9AGAM|nr:hypothetical protein SCLCIDRAFT_436680 [Scleroderma citrinum Foug A]
MKFSYTFNDIKLGDYGHFTDSEDFRCEGNLFDDLKSLSLKANITSRRHKISERGGCQSEGGVVRAHHYSGGFTELYQPLGLSLLTDDVFKSLLVSRSTRLTNRYLITIVIQCLPNLPRPGSGTTHLYDIAKPFVWHRNKGAGSAVGEW